MVMTRSKKRMEAPQKLTSFFPSAPHVQDGHRKRKEVDSPSTESSSSSISPSKMSPHASSQLSTSLLSTKSSAVSDHLPGSPAKRSPRDLASPVTMADMQGLLSELRETIHKDIHEAVATLHADISAIGERTAHLEEKMEDFSAAHNTLVDSHNDMMDEVEALKLKMADLEDRSRRNNIRLRNIPESISDDKLQEYLIDLFTAVLPDTPERDLLIDRAHRVPKPKSLPQEVPRDVLTRLHFYHFKDTLLKAASRKKDLPERFQNISFYADLSPATLSRRREFTKFTQILRDNHIPYKWGFPVKLIIFRNGSNYIASSPKAAASLFDKWSITTPLDGDVPPPKNKDKPTSIQQEWNKAGSPRTLPRSSSSSP